MLTVPRSWDEVTPGWMTGALARRFPGALVNTVELATVEEGTNRRARALLTWSPGMPGAAPASVFVKLSGRPSHRLALAVLGALPNEARLADGDSDLPLEHPDLYGGGVDWGRLAAVVVMEDVTARGARANRATAPLAVEAVRDGLVGLARLHAAHWGRPSTSQLAFVRPWRLGRALSAVSIAHLAHGLRRLDAQVAEGGARRALSPWRLGREFRESTLLTSRGVPTLLHGDPHPGNTYTLGEHRTGFFDWQLVRAGHWSHDVAYFLVSSLRVADRRLVERTLLASYLETLDAAGAPAPRFDAAWLSYRAGAAFGLATWIHTLSFGTLQRDDVCLATIERFSAAYTDLETSAAIGELRG